MENKIELTKIIDIVNERNSITKSDAYRFGYDCGINGANQTNCNCAIFSSREKTKEWERGKADADSTKV